LIQWFAPNHRHNRRSDRTLDDPDRDANLVALGFVPMSFVKWAFVGLLVLPIAEIMTFIVVSVIFGWLQTVMLFVATTVLGIYVLKRCGRADLNRLRSAVTKGGLRAIHLDTPGLGAIVGSVLLIIPGFLTDILGLLLFVPRLRGWIGATLGATLGRARRERRPRSPVKPKTGPDVIDLEPDEWRQITDGSTDKNRPARRRKRAVDQAP
jgi:UPF0716 protein FxsA